MPPHEEFFRRSMRLLRDAPLFAPNPTFANPPWEKSGLRVLILRLSSFRDVERSSPHTFLASRIRRAAPDSFVDMAFLPLRKDREVMRSGGAPLILGTQSHRPLADFPLVLVSHSCIPELVNLPFLLAGSGVPLWASARGEEWPAIILGGSSSAAAHPIVRPDGDCMADAIFFGEGEGAVERIVSLWGEGAGQAKRDGLERLAGAVEGLWPAGRLDRRVRRAVAPDGPAAVIPAPVLPGEEAGTARLAITRGCPCLCSFCFEGFDRRPFHQWPVPDLLAAARSLKAATGAETLEIESFNFNTHEDIGELLMELNRIFPRVNPMSQRVDILSREPGLLEQELAAGKRSFTLGIEGVSERQRRFLHKSLTGEEIRRILTALHKAPVREIKLFFILTGRETSADLEEFAGQVRWLKTLRAGSGPRVIFSFGLLVRMPFTPLRHDPCLLDEKAWRPLIGKAKSACETNGFEFRLSTSWTDYLAIQVLAAGGYETSNLLERLAAAGCVYDQEFPPEARSLLDEWVAGRDFGERPAGHPFPFAFLEAPGEEDALFRGWQDAKAGKDSGYCRRGSPGGACEDCPGCTLSRPAGRAGSRPLDPGTRAAGLARAAAISALMVRKARLAPVHVEVLIPEEAAHRSREWRDAWLLRRLLELLPGQEENVLSVREALVTPWAAARSGAPFPAWFGSSVAAVTAWDTEPVTRLLTGPEIGPPLPSFTAGTWKALGVHISLPTEGGQAIPGLVSRALEAQHTPVTIRRMGESFLIGVGEKALKRRGIRSGSFSAAGDRLSLMLVIGTAFDVPGLVTALSPDGCSSALLEVTAFEL